MTTSQKARDLVSQTPKDGEVVATSYSSLPVDIPDDFLAPLPDPTVIKTEKIDFTKTPLPQYKDCFAVVLDNILSQEECDQLIRFTEMSAGAHRDDYEVPSDGWRPAMVNVGAGHEVLDISYRNSDRIIWDNTVLTRRIWDRVLQVEGFKEYFSVLEGKKYSPVMGGWAGDKGDKWVLTKQGLNERMRFLKYGAGQFFRPHCDGAYHTPDGTQRTFYTLHLYLNDSAQELEKEGITPAEGTLRGGATTFHSNSGWREPETDRRLDVDPKAGRVLIFQHRRLNHSGDEVISGVKYTMRSDVLYEFV